jgi:hypothetical protein
MNCEVNTLSSVEIDEVSGGMSQFGTWAAGFALVGATTGQPEFLIVSAGLWLAGELSGD